MIWSQHTQLSLPTLNGNLATTLAKEPSQSLLSLHIIGGLGGCLIFRQGGCGFYLYRIGGGSAFLAACSN